MPEIEEENKTEKRRLKPLIIIVVAAVAVIAMALLIIGKDSLASSEPTRVEISVDFAAYPIQGIDISAHNGEIDFEQVAQSGITFVYVKASEGANYRDRRFVENVTRAHQAGLKVGAYHFFRKDVEGDKQAINFIRAARAARLDLPYVIDIEDWENSMFVRNSTVKDNLKEMINQLRHVNFDVMIYTNKNGYSDYIKDDFTNMPLWLCTFTHPDSIDTQINWQLHQYSHWGSIPGIAGDVDLDLFCGDSLQWEQWVATGGYPNKLDQ